MNWKILLEKVKTEKNLKLLHALCQERGAVFVLTAILLPVLCGFMGIAYDVGNLYMHKAKLQNVTDAAALAGGAVFKERSDQKTDEKNGTRINLISNNHNLADDAATNYINKNKIDVGSSIVIDELSALPGLKSTTTSNNGNVSIEKQNIYYRVIASDTVPLYFLPVIMSDTHDQLVRTASVALVETTTRTTTSGGGGSSQTDKTVLDNLFTFSASIYSPDKFNVNDYAGSTKNIYNLENTFDGAIIYTNTSSSMNFREQVEALKYMFPAAGAKGLAKTAYEIIDSFTSYAERVDIDFASDTYKNIFTKKFTSPENAGQRVTLNNGQQITPDVLNSRIAAGKNIFVCNDMDQGNIQLNQSLNGNSTEPIFIMYDQNRHMLNISVTADTVRPIVVVYLGTSDIYIQNSSNGTFRGIIYAPNAMVKPMNNNNFAFYGNIIAKSLWIEGGNGNYQAFHLVNYLKGDPDFDGLPVYTHRTGSVTQAIYDATFKEALQELVNGTSSININGWENQKRQQQMLDRVYELLYNSGSDPAGIINDPTKVLDGNSSTFINGDTLDKLSKADFFRAWVYAYESTLNKLKARYDDFELSDLNKIDKVSWDNDVPSSGGGGGSGETTVTKSSTLRLINPRTEDNPYFNSESKI